MTRKKRRQLEALAHLRELDLFVECSDEHLRAADHLMADTTVRKGHALTVAGTGAREAMVVVEGWADVYAGDVMVDTLGPGSVVGEIALLEGTTRTATVRARTDMRVLVLNAAEFQDLLRDAPCVARRIKEVAEARREALQRLVQG